MSEETKVVIEEQPEVQEEKIEIDITGLTKEEVELGKGSEVIPREEKKEEDKKESLEKKEDVDKDEKKDPATFEEMDEVYNKDEKKFTEQFTSNAKGLYFKLKHNKKLRQEAQEALDEATEEREFLSTKEKSYIKQLADIEDLINKIDEGDDKITTADIRKIIAFRKETQEKIEEKEDKKSPLTDKKQEERTQKYLEEKSKNTQLLGKGKYEDFDHYVNLANEVVAQDKDMAVLITQAYINPEVDEEQLVEKIVKVARTHPKFGEKPKEEKNQSDIERILANSNKKKTSAALTTGSGRREVDFNDLTVEDVPKLSQKQWNNLPDEVRSRLLKEVSKAK